ncbi:carbohydrate esterase family 2 protein [Xylariaceae sp. FL0255]|nr:carbohydrate esterase family 2 protein [Xylariaceae sp. FL0255]
MHSSLFSILLAGTAVTQQAAWGQCGGLGYTGDTACATGYTCIYVKADYSQCQTGQTPSPSTTSTSTLSPTSSPGVGTPGVKYLGRVNPSTNELSWPGTNISFTFTGTSATIALTSVMGTNSVDLIIDGGAPIVISNLRKRSEAIYGSIFIGAVTTDGILGVNVAPTRQIEIIGDLITVSYGLDGVNPCTNTAAIEDNHKIYEALASGKSLIRNFVTNSLNINPLILKLLTRYRANNADNIVINLGTNNFSYLAFNASGNPYDARSPIDSTAYTAGLVSFLQTIQKHYTNANFFILSSPMLSDYHPTTADAQKTTQTTAIQNAVTQLGSKAHFVDWSTQGSDVGCDYQPNAATQAAEDKFSVPL